MLGDHYPGGVIRLGVLLRIRRVHLALNGYTGLLIFEDGYQRMLLLLVFRKIILGRVL